MYSSNPNRSAFAFSMASAASSVKAAFVMAISFTLSRFWRDMLVAD